jgi:hypothetical protein
MAACTAAICLHLDPRSLHFPARAVYSTYGIHFPIPSVRAPQKKTRSSTFQPLRHNSSFPQPWYPHYQLSAIQTTSTLSHHPPALMYLTTITNPPRSSRLITPVHAPYPSLLLPHTPFEFVAKLGYNHILLLTLQSLLAKAADPTRKSVVLCGGVVHVVCGSWLLDARLSRRGGGLPVWPRRVGRLGICSWTWERGRKGLG